MIRWNAWDIEIDAFPEGVCAGHCAPFYCSHAQNVGTGGNIE
jgi:hypothetical protein